jgi:tetratricopeptide (TPR) repeat protein/transglutaminase-like putative cysteine protease
MPYPSPTPRAALPTLATLALALASLTALAAAPAGPSIARPIGRPAHGSPGAQAGNPAHPGKAAAAPARLPEPWEGPAFSASAADLLRAASAYDGGEDGVALLYTDTSYTYDAAGRETYTQRLVYRITDAAAHESWSSIEESWAPWHQERPRLRARVIAPDGTEHTLDPATVTENAASQSSDDMYEDGRVLRAPLPATGPGAVVEQEVLVRDTAPFFEGGVVRFEDVSMDVPVRHARVVLEAPAELPLRWTSRLLPGAPREETTAGTGGTGGTGGMHRLTFEYRDLPADEDAEEGLPSDVPRTSYLAFSTGRSWSDLARRYSEIVDRSIQGSDLSRVLRGAGTGASQLDTINALLSRLAKEVRYTGVELGEGSLVPRKPADTLKRKFGDCKDKAVLLTALLRASDIPAYVALLNAGEGTPDVEAGLPGFGGFNHAIVMVPGHPAVWIDPTDPYARAGELPAQDQGRLALVASPTADALVRTPEAVSADNREIETREFYLADLGHARVVETTEYFGAQEQDLRASYAAADPKEMHDALEQYVTSVYLAKRLVKLDHTPPDDLAQPFRLRLEADGARRGTTDVSEAAVAIFPAQLVQRLPDEITASDDDKKDADPDADAADAPEPRQGDYVFTRPFQVELRYHIVPPAGFVPQPLPPSRQRQLGPATLAETYTANADGTVSATLLFDAGKRRLTAQEFESLRAAVRGLADDKPLLVLFEQVGESHLGAGRVREALDEFRRLAALDPKKALPRTRISRALLAGGLGEAARQEAQAAVQLEPKLAHSWENLGWVLQHDLVGRRFGKGFDRKGAIAAYRKAKELDADDAGIRTDLAILLEHDADGVRYGPGSDLAAAIDEYRALRKDLSTKDLDDNLLIALMRAGRFAEMRDLAKEIDASESRSTLKLVATAVLDGPDAALRESERSFSDSKARAGALATAGQNLMALRRYGDAAALFDRASRLSPNAAALLSLAEVLRKAKKHEELTFAAGQPADLPKRLVAAVASEPFDVRGFLALFTHDAFPETVKPEDEDQLRTVLRNGLTSGFDAKSSGISLDTAIDLGLASVQETVTGDDKIGYRVRLTSSLAQSAVMSLFAVPESGEYRIAALQNSPENVAAEALRRVGRNDLRGARQWLDWASEEIRTAKGEDDPLSGAPFHHVWTKGREATADEVRCAAATVMAFDGETAGQSVPILRDCRGRDAAHQSDFDLALASAYLETDKLGDAAEVAGRLSGDHPDSDRAYSLLVISLTRAKKWDELRAAAQHRIEKDPDDVTGLRTLAEIAMNNGDLRQARELLGKILASGKANPTDYNNLAWLALFDATVDDQSIQYGQQAATLTDYHDASTLHTLASLYAAQGKTAEAYRLILQALDARESSEPTSADWYVFGRLAEQYGMADAARGYYKKVTPDDNGTSTFQLAKRRLQALGNAPAAPAAPVRRAARS